MDKEHKDPETIDLRAPRLAHFMHKAWKKHQNTVYWVDINLAQRKGLKFYQTRSNAIFLYDTLPAYCIPKVVRMESGEIIYEKVRKSLRQPPTISLKHDWMKDSGSEVALQAEGPQPIQPNPNPNHDRTGTRCDWTTYRFVHNVQRGGHRLQSLWIATFSCETSRKFSCS